MLLAPLLAVLAANPYLERATAHVAGLRFDEALVELEAAEHVPGISLSERLGVLELRGRCQVALGKKAEAERAFTQLLELEPKATLDPATSPKIREVFDAAKQRLYPQGYVKLKLLPEMEESGRVRALLVDPYSRVSTVVARFRTVLDGPWADAPLAAGADGVWVATLPHRCEWFLEARGAGGAVTSEGSAEAPHGALARPAAVAAAPAAVVESSGWSLRRRAGLGTAVAGAVVLVGAFILWGLAGGSLSAAKGQEWADVGIGLESRAHLQASWGNGLFASGLLVGAAGTALVLPW